ncbi:MAG: putative signal peptide protein [Myxococcales bacterium]|nr:putative signal peptide protein [Myxococcales bacterium]
MIPYEKRRFYLFCASALGAAVALAIAFTMFGASGRARRIASKNEAARGGLAAWRAVKTMSMSGKLDAGVRRDPAKLAMSYQNQLRLAAQARRALANVVPPTEKPVQLPFTMELERPRKSRLEIRFQGETAVQVYDGKEGWKLRPFLGRREVEPYTNEELHLAAQQSDLDGWLVDASAKGEKLELIGTDKIDGRDAYNIKVTLSDGQVRHVWVDTHSYLEVKVDGSRQLDGKLRPMWTYYREYKKVDGLLVPHVLETVVEGVAGSEKIVIDRVAINPQLADARFAKLDPVAVKAEDAQVKPTKPGDTTPAPGDAKGDAHAQHREKLARATRSTAEYKIPQLTLLRDDGKSVSLPQELDDGRVVVLNFVFTNCATICPVMSQVFSQLQDKLGADRNKVHMVSISIDPEQDRPERLAEYGKKLHAGPQWRQYTGTTQASVAAQRAFDAYRGDKMNHTPLTFLRAAPGRSWVRIDGFASADELASEVRAQLADR